MSAAEEILRASAKLVEDLEETCKSLRILFEYMQANETCFEDAEVSCVAQRMQACNASLAAAKEKLRSNVDIVESQINVLQNKVTTREIIQKDGRLKALFDSDAELLDLMAKTHVALVTELDSAVKEME